MLVKFVLGEVDIFKIGDIVDDKGHGKDENAEFFSFFLRNTAVAVRDNCRFQNKLLFRSHIFRKFFRGACLHKTYPVSCAHSSSPPVSGETPRQAFRGKAALPECMRPYNIIIAERLRKVNCFSYKCYRLHKKVLQNKVFYRE